MKWGGSFQNFDFFKIPKILIFSKISKFLIFFLFFFAIAKFFFPKFSIFSKFPKFGPGVADSGLLLTKQSIRRTGAVLNVLQGEEGASTNGKTHSRAVEPYRTGALFTRRRRRLYYSENVYHDARAAESSKVIKYRI